MKKTTYFDDINIDFNEWIDDYNYFKREDDENWTDVDTNNREYIDWVYRMLQLDWEDFEENIKPIANAEVTISGSLGLWNGRHVVQDVETTFGDAIRKCTSCGDYVKIYVEADGEDLKVKEVHHDGTNNFTIKFKDESVLSDGYLF